jgi:DNA-binding NarL/FixJ family response regulator
MSTTSLEPARDSIGDRPRPADRSPGPVVLVVDEDAWLRSRMCHLLQTAPKLALAGVVDTEEEAMWMAEHERVDVAMVAHRPRSGSGLWLCRDLKRSAARPAVVICSAYPDAVLMARCVVAEADALVSIYDSDADLAGVLHRVSRGIRALPVVPPRLGAMLHVCLDPAEHAIFSMLLAGLPASDVARGLRISPAELESRQSVLLRKLETLPPTSGKPY